MLQRRAVTAARDGGYAPEADIGMLPKSGRSDGTTDGKV
jgi:hypothetical protein